MDERFLRTSYLIGEETVKKLNGSRVIVFGIGGVGSFVCEALARSGIGSLTLVDRDTVSVSNINRQLIALESTVGLPKTQVMKERILQINPEAEVVCKDVFYGKENEKDFDFSQYDYVVDAIDTVSSKLCLIQNCFEKNTPIISSMGTGNKLCPEKLKIDDIKKTSMCPLARVMRRELRKLGIDRLKVLYSTEEPVELKEKVFDAETKKQIPGSISFVPSVAGLMIAGEVIKDLIK